MMENLTPLNSKQVKQFLKFLEESFGYEEKSLKKLQFYIKKRDGSIKISTRDVSYLNDKRVNVDSCGLKIAKKFSDGYALNIEGSQIIGPYCKEGIVDVSKDDAIAWLKGDNISFESGQNRFVLIRFGKDFLGSGKLKDGMIINNIPKPRRLNVSKPH